MNLLNVLVVGALLPSDALAREHVVPDRNDDRAARAASWTLQNDGQGQWRVSPAVQAEPADDGAEGGSRVAAMLSVGDAGGAVVQARGLAADSDGACTTAGAGPWTTLEETYTGGELHVAVVDLDARYACAQLRIRDSRNHAVGDLQWELVEPRFPDVGRASRSFVARQDPQMAIPAELETIGVITREEWDARPTQCSSVEDDWYRMAIHHTAGPQTANGSVIERLQGTQAYAMDSGGYCDIPYQMLVGFDGTLYEGRGVELTSGATGGGNNPGNLAVCFIGCYHEPQSQCVGGVGHQPTDEMMQRGQLLVQTLVRMEDISTAEDNIRGHRDWPGNSTACPGELLYPRLGELRADLAWFSALESERSWKDEVIEVPVDASVELWIELENTGGLPWEPGQTFLAPTDPRDGESPLYDDAWPAESRAATVDSTVQPGEIGRFAMTISLASQDTVTQSFGLVHEGVTWFADPPWGGGPADDAVVLTVRGTAVGESDGGSTSGGDGSTSDIAGTGGGTGDGPEEPEETTGGETSGASTAALPPADDPEQGCGCRSQGGESGWGLLLLGVLGLRRRRR
ncbi:MAG: N-acetylmuramoyl-L-alanine amidase [Nannocystaceae bacterium]